MTLEVMDNEWFHTGDIGQMNEDGTLSIIDRRRTSQAGAGRGEAQGVAVTVTVTVFSICIQRWMAHSAVERKGTCSMSTSEESTEKTRSPKSSIGNTFSYSAALSVGF